MKPAQKQRLVGGIVLLALGLIIVPTVLDFSGEERVIGEIEIPPEPEQMKTEVLDLQAWSKGVEPDLDQSEKVIEEPEPVVDEIAQSESDVTEVAKVVEQPAKQTLPKTESSPPVQKQHSEPKVEQTQAPKTAKSVEPLKPGASGWVVQIGSFTTEDKAFALRDRLRKADYPTFVERAKADSGSVYRVKIGPVLNRNDAESLKKRAMQTVKLDGLIMRYQ